MRAAELLELVAARRANRRRVEAWHGDRDAARAARLASIQAELARPLPWQAGPEQPS